MSNPIHKQREDKLRVAFKDRISARVKARMTSYAKDKYDKQIEKYIDNEVTAQAKIELNKVEGVESKFGAPLPDDPYFDVYMVKYLAEGVAKPLDTSIGMVDSQIDGYLNLFMKSCANTTLPHGPL